MNSHLLADPLADPLANPLANPWAHSPQPVYIPESAGIKRNVIVNEMKAGGDSAVKGPLDEEARSEYDSRTLFYDMFFKSGDLICLGPPFLNLGTPTAVCCDGEAVSFTCNHNRVEPREPSVLRFKLPSGEIRERLNLKFSFPEFEATASLDALRAHPPTLPFRDMCLHTIQKDNPGEWIRDWCLWHHRMHGVQRVIIYDNGSRDFPELGGAFAGLDASLEIILVHWPFPYGPITTSHNNRFCQVGALNHFRLFFGDTVRWGLNLDIDEYLHINTRRSLKEFLAQPGRARSPVVYLGSLKFPRPDVPKDILPRFFHHKFYISDREKFWVGRKYIFQPARVSYCSTHNAFPIFPELEKNQGLRLLQRARRRLRRVLRKGMRRCLQAVSGWGVDGYGSRRRLEADDDILFHHYFGLYDGWVKKYDYHKPGVGDFPQDALVEHSDVKDLAARAGLTEAVSSTK